jgi:uncharacterized protein YpiB (UPF0302 family)
MITLHFESVEQAEDYANELELECKALKHALEQEMFDDYFTHRMMAEELRESLEKLDELYTLINQLKYPSLH